MSVLRLSSSSSSSSMVLRGMFLLVIIILLQGTTIMAEKDPNCEYDCGPFGQCELDTRACIHGKSCKYECVCRLDFRGPDCSTWIQRCDNPITHSHDDDNNFCLNGGVCEEFEENGAITTRCNCQKAAGADKAHAGHHCENEQDDVCEIGKSMSSYAFCVNKGTCRFKVQPGEPHPMCDCPPGFVGRHCQFQSDSAPVEELIYVDSGGMFILNPPEQQQEEKKLSGQYTFLVVAVALGCLAILSGLMLHRHRRRRAAMETDAHNHRAAQVTSDLNLAFDENEENNNGNTEETDGSRPGVV